MGETSRPAVKVTWAEMVRDVLVASINKGQFPTAFLGFVLCIAVAKLPSEEVVKAGREIFAYLVNGYLLGYVLFLMALGGWYTHAKRILRISAAEQKRLGDERTELQNELLGKKVRSSKK